MYNAFYTSQVATCWYYRQHIVTGTGATTPLTADFVTVHTEVWANRQHSLVIQFREVTADSSIVLISQPLKQRKRLLEKLHQKRLKLSRDAILHEQLIDIVHRQRPKVARMFRHVCNTVTPKTGKVEDDLQNGWSDQTGEGHPAEEVGQALESKHTDFL